MSEDPNKQPTPPTTNPFTTNKPNLFGNIFANKPPSTTGMYLFGQPNTTTTNSVLFPPKPT